MSSRLLCFWVCFEVYVLLKRSAPLGRHRPFLLDLHGCLVPVPTTFEPISCQYTKSDTLPLFSERPKVLSFLRIEPLTFSLRDLLFFIVHFYNKGILYTIDLSCNADMSQLLKAYTYSTPSLGHIEEKLPIKIVINRSTRRKSWTVSLLFI